MDFKLREGHSHWSLALGLVLPMVTTIFFSLLYAFGFVMPLLAAAGPSGNQFAFRPLTALKRMVFKARGIIMGNQ